MRYMRYMESLKGYTEDFIDCTYYHPVHLIDGVPPQLYAEVNTNRIYHFGYIFNNDADPVEVNEYILALKQIGNNPLTDYEVEQFISHGLGELNEVIRTYDLECIVYPGPDRCQLVSEVMRCVGTVISRDSRKCSFEFVQTAEGDSIDKFRGSEILVIDSMNNMKPSVDDVVDRLVQVNSNANIYVFTLIGK